MLWVAGKIQNLKTVNGCLLRLAVAYTGGHSLSSLFFHGWLFIFIRRHRWTIPLDNPIDSLYHATMKTEKSKKPETNFNDFWPFLKSEAYRQRLKKGEWFRKSGVDYQRYSEFETGARDISVRYFLKLMGGLNLKTDTAEKALGHKFTEEQKRLMKFDAKVAANRDWLAIVLDDPEKLKICKGIAGSKIS